MMIGLVPIKSQPGFFVLFPGGPAVQTDGAELLLFSGDDSFGHLQYSGGVSTGSIRILAQQARAFLTDFCWITQSWITRRGSLGGGSLSI